jgi:hypothetical protein|uniref:Uncharacterized protein n=1 Tax=viral metagenome TaxID=1070528 RepID=A0A6C0H4D4_9ZZZZ
MANENKVIFYSEELNEDIYQNNKLLTSKKIILENNEKEQINQNLYNTIVDSKDYLGCINNNCSAIKMDCSKTENNSNNIIDTINNSNTKSNKQGAISNYITKVIDFVFILILVGLLIFIIYKKESLYLLYVLGITLVYIFIKFLMLSNI